MPKHLSVLSNISMISILFVMFYVFAFISRIEKSSKNILILPEYWRIGSSGYFQSLGTFFFSYSIHHNIIPIYYSLRKNSITRFSFSLFTSILLSTIIYFLCMISGFLSFSGVVNSNLFQSYCPDDKLIIAARIVFTITLMGTYPFQIFSARDAILEISKDYFSQTKWIRYSISFALVLIYGIFSLISKSVGPIIEIGGALTAGPLTMIFPPLIYYKSITKITNIGIPHLIFLTFLVISGILLMIIGPVFSIRDMLQGENEIPQYWC
uniref:Putative sodium-coupled neutral amino acid transporter 11 n=1 Tax=Henneguya salminicola TaxID=69463 RepID=A0A6G3MFJ6_HENSL